MSKKETKFIGYLGGDCECDCLVASKEYDFDDWLYMKKMGNILYLTDLFPEEVDEHSLSTPLKAKKYRFKITVEVEEVPIFSDEISKKAVLNV